MKLEQLHKIDPSLTLIKGQMSDEFSGLTTFEHLSDSHLLFIKDKKFYLRNESLIKDSDFKSMGVILEEKFNESLSDEDKALITSKFKTVLTAKSVPLAMSFLSKPFYDLKYRELNDLVDGRQMGTASVHPTAWIAQGAHIGEGVEIGEGVKIHSGVRIMSYAKIASHTEIYPNAVVYPYVKIGSHCRIHAGASIGADGFGYNFDKGIHHKVWHMGSVIVEDHVEIGANSCVDQGTFTPTKIGAGTKIDNHVQVGHNVVLGAGVVICGHVAIGGSTKIGAYTVFGGKSGCGDGLILGQACQVAGGALVNCDWPDGSVVAGHPARPLKEWMKGIAYLRKLSLGK
ncbi:UDP-3-O-[3-hydroxymyristoyl] glucosamine N-acyltransferase [Bacteriovorax sp. BSW11_IV]|uniref:UDP-3-O-(3-hydroxymyristoyl)glucosamine N-acyltransferase n=1 Tax=Bacteriovorax sp. BSW11_IV TaxID=1353529 RepID=UPI00038A156A|nr:UDP-3-O-(3-hydroxymyristoyl)glucosamine N-acyltransferase [Bacteriovorax sp. BSW11_IV]EQC48936.1 UDP-3-O-[3-hydroxymyristoyl] glucosamine N-acyltransferase [Bacteriovorax sp. BSW11_IV]